jgi:integrase
MGKQNKTASGQADVLDDRRIRIVLATLEKDRDRAMFLLSVKAGLRAKEIAGLTWDRVDLPGRRLALNVTKGGKPRIVAIAADLLEALVAYRDVTGRKTGPVFTNEKDRPGQPIAANTVASWFRDLYGRKLGWKGFSSHSGRRTFVTKVARKITEAGGSLRDVQAMVGHANLSTTQRYIETNDDAQRLVVDLI